MFIIVTVFFIIIKAFIPQYSYVLMPVLVILLVKNYNANLFFAYYLLFVFSSGTFLSSYILIFFNIFLIYYENLKNKDVSKTFLFFNVFLFIILIITINNYHSLYDLLRLLTIATTFGILTLKYRKIELGVFDKTVYIIFISLLFAQLIFKFRSTDLIDQRETVFLLSENIGIIIFLILFLYVLFSNSISNRKKTLSFFLYTVVLFTTSSRSLFLIFLILIIAGFKYFSFKKYLALLTSFFLFLFIIINNNLSYLIEKYPRSADLFNIGLLYFNDNVELDKLDLRTMLLNDAYNKFLNKPLFGNGVMNPDYFVGKENMVSFHNSVSDIFVTYGIFGGFILLISGYFLIKRMKTENDFFYIISLFSVALLSVFQPLLFNIQVMSLLFILIFIKKTGINRVNTSSNMVKFEKF